jgi:hypothetical protein
MKTISRCCWQPFYLLYQTTNYRVFFAISLWKGSSLSILKLINLLRGLFKNRIILQFSEKLEKTGTFYLNTIFLPLENWRTTYFSSFQIYIEFGKHILEVFQPKFFYLNLYIYIYTLVINLIFIINLIIFFELII